MNWYPFPIRIKVSIWSLLRHKLTDDQRTLIKAIVWCAKALIIGIVIAFIIYKLFYV